MAPESLAFIIRRGLVQRMLVPGLVLAFFVAGFSVLTQKRNAERLNMLLAETMARYVGTFVEESFAALRGMTEPASKGSLGVIAAQMEQLRRISPNFDRLFWVDRERRVILAEPRGRTGVDFSVHFDNLEGRNLILSRPVFAHPERRIVIYIGHRFESGEILAAELNLESLAAHLTDLMAEEPSRITVTDAYGNVIVHPDRRLVVTQANIGDNPLFLAARNGPASLVYRSGADNVLGTADIIAGLGWRVLVEREARQVFIPALVPVVTVCGFMGLVLALFTFLLRREFAERIVQPMARLTGALREVGETGSAVFPDENSFSELSALRQGLQDMAGRIADREQRLVEGELRFRAIFEQAAVGIGQSRVDGSISRVNQRFCDITGYSQEELQGKAFREITHPEDQALGDESMRRLLAGEMDTYSIEKRYLRKGGGIVWVNLTVSLQRDAAGGVRFILGVVQDISDRKRAEEALRENESKYRALFDEAQDMILLADAETGILLECNREAEKMLGWPRSELIGRHQSALHPEEEQGQKVTRTFAAHLGGMRGELLESRIVTRRGAVLDVAIKGNTFDLNGRKVIMGIFRDITEAKRGAARIEASLHEKEILLREVHHRVKNNLQIISGLLYLQSEAGTSPEAAEMFAMSRNRISSMALVHEEIYRSDDFSGVNLKSYAAKLLPRIVNSGRGSRRIECVLEIEDVWVSIDKAVPLGLIMNEIVTNALKHAFAGRDSGTILVRMSRQGERLKVEMRDDGVGLPQGFDPDASPTLGMQLISNLTRQLKGELVVEGNGGTRFLLDLPL